MVLDLEDEYRRLAETVDGTKICLGAPGVRLNAFDLEIHTRSAPSDALTRRRLFLRTLDAGIAGRADRRAENRSRRALVELGRHLSYIGGILES